MHLPRNGAATSTMGGGLHVKGNMDLLDGLLRWLGELSFFARLIFSASVALNPTYPKSHANPINPTKSLFKPIQKPRGDPRKSNKNPSKS